MQPGGYSWRQWCVRWGADPRDRRGSEEGSEWAGRQRARRYSQGDSRDPARSDVDSLEAEVFMLKSLDLLMAGLWQSIIARQDVAEADLYHWGMTSGDVEEIELLDNRVGEAREEAHEVKLIHDRITQMVLDARYKRHHRYHN